MSEKTAVQTVPSVLVIDDEQGLRDMLVFGLTDRGYRVVTASNGEEGIEKIKHEQFDLAICDIMMPGKGGVDVLKAARDNQSETEFVMATGYATLETAIEAMKLGAYDYITKPYSLDQIEALFTKALEHRRLKNRVDHLEELNRMKSEFLANMSHELRTPMNAIIGYSSLMVDKIYGDLNPKQEQGLKRIQVNAKNLLELINNILDLSKLSAGRMLLFVGPCNVKEIVDEVLDTMDCLARERHIKLSADTPANLDVRADKTKLKQVLVNLVANAIKFTHEGEVFLRAERISNPDAVRIHVRDSGIGIQEEDIPLLFQEFCQLDSSPTREYGGTGLGLSICKKIVELHGGDIQVKSAVGAGSTFIVTIPVEAEVLNEHPQFPKTVFKGNGKGKIVLGIDDDPEVLTILSDSLEGTGYTFVGAQSAEEGLALARQMHPHAITLDIMMPHMDGWSVLQTLKNDPELKSIPVFIISIVENKALGFSLGVADYIVKPFDRASLLQKLNTVKDEAVR